MSKFPSNDDGLNDADLATLFASNKSEPPKELDQLVLDNALLSQHDSLAQQQETFTQKYAPLFGTAAVLMIAIGLTPLTINAPESFPDLAQGPAPAPEPTQATTAAEALVSRQAADSAMSTEAASVVADTADMDSNEVALDATDELAGPQPIAADLTVTTESIETMPISAADTDAIGIDENTTHQSESTGSNTAEQTNYTKEQELIANDTSVDLAKNKAGIVDKIESTAINSIVHAELNADSESANPAPIVAENAATPDNEVADETKRSRSSTTASDLFELNTEEYSPASSIKSFDAVETQINLNEIKDNNAIQKRKIESPTIAPNSQTTNKSLQLEQVQEQDESIRAQQGVSQTNGLTREKTKNYRSTALLWIIEIKHLYKVNKTDQAQKELALFRKKFPNNDNERLLPKELLDTNPK